jgi:hypothetical protein
MIENNKDIISIKAVEHPKFGYAFSAREIYKILVELGLEKQSFHDNSTVDYLLSEDATKKILEKYNLKLHSSC